MIYTDHAPCMVIYIYIVAFEMDCVQMKTYTKV